jgi:hypothetical protein
VTNVKAPEYESVIPDPAAYRKFPVREGDNEEVLLLKYRAAQLDTLRRLTGKPPQELQSAVRDPKVQAKIRAHNVRMRLLDQTA